MCYKIYKQILFTYFSSKDIFVWKNRNPQFSKENTYSVTFKPVWIMKVHLKVISCCCCCRLIVRLSHEGPRPISGVPSVGVFLSDSSPYLSEFPEKLRKTTERPSRHEWPGIEIGTSCLPVLHAEPLCH